MFRRHPEGMCGFFILIRSYADQGSTRHNTIDLWVTLITHHILRYILPVFFEKHCSIMISSHECGDSTKNPALGCHLILHHIHPVSFYCVRCWTGWVVPVCWFSVTIPSNVAILPMSRCCASLKRVKSPCLLFNVPFSPCLGWSNHHLRRWKVHQPKVEAESSVVSMDFPLGKGQENHPLRSRWNFFIPWKIPMNHNNHHVLVDSCLDAGSFIMSQEHQKISNVDLMG